METDIIHVGDAKEVLKSLPSSVIDCVVTSPPYWGLRDYGVEGQLGLEPTFQEYIVNLCDVFDEVKRVLKPEGTCWVNLGDTYITKGASRHKNHFDPLNPKGRKSREFIPSGLPQSLPAKCLVQIPNRFAIAMCDRGWLLRNEIIWHKPSVIPESVTDRFTNNFEKIFFFVKQSKYYFERQFEPYAYTNPLNCKKGVRFNPKGRNMRCVWSITTQASGYNHFAAYPERLITIPIKAGCPEGGIVMDPFIGTGTTALTAKKLGRRYIGIELNKEYYKISQQKLSQKFLPFASPEM